MKDLVHLILLSIGGAFLGLLERLRLKKLRNRRQENHCIHCNYDLRGTTQECPECGAACKAANPAGVSPAAEN